MDKKRTAGRRALVFLADLLMTALGLVGTIFCITTAFGLSADTGRLLGTALLCAALAAGLYSVPRRLIRTLLCLLALAALAILAWRGREPLYLAAMVTAREVTGAFAEALGVGGPFDITPYVGGVGPFRERAAVTLLLQLLSGVLGLWLGWIVVRLRSFGLSLLGIFPFLLVPLSVTITPDWPPLLLLVLFWGVGLLVRLPRRQDPWGSAKQTLLLLPPALGLLLLVGAAFPQAGYQHAEWAARTRLELTDLLARATHGSAAIESGLGLALGGSADVDLGSAGPLAFTGSTVLRVESGTTGHIYLRGFSAATYTGDGWEQLPDEAYQEGAAAEERQGTSTGGITGLWGYQPLNFPAMADVHVPAVRMVVENVGAPDRFVYTPYQLITSPDRMTGAEFVGDAYLARGVGVWKHILYVRDRASPQHDTALTGEAMAAELRYRAFVKEHYLQIPGNMVDIIEHLVKDAGLEPVMDADLWQDSPGSSPAYGDLYQSGAASIPEYDGRTFALSPRLSLRVGEMVADYLSQIAEYDPDTPAAPAGEDFVACFVGEGRGYCMHFASTAVLMLRAMGIPARYVSGYVADVRAGELVDVPDYNAHAWVEIYCEGYGWQPVEVTPGFDGVFPWENQTVVQATATPAPSEGPRDDAVPTPAPTQGAANQGGAATEQTEQTDLRWLLVPAALFLLCTGLVLRRRLARRGRARRFHGTDVNQAVIEVYGYCAQVLSFAPGSALDGEMEALGQKARFSQHVLTEEERAWALRYADTLAQTTEQGLRWHKKLVFRYLSGLY